MNRLVVFVFLFIVLSYVSRIAIPTLITANFTILDGHLLAKHQSSRVPQLETEITTVSSTVKTEVEKKFSISKGGSPKTLPPSENIIGIEMKTNLSLSYNNGTVETEMKKKVPQFKDVGRNEVGKSLPQWSRNEVKRKLSPSVIDHVKTFVFFIGHGRSGHSIVGSIMDSHPNMVIASEVDVFARLSDGSLVPTKAEIFNALWVNSKETIINGLRSKYAKGKGYDLYVDGLYEGRYVDHIDVIGDKKGGITTQMLATEPDKWSQVYNILKSLNVSIKVILVIRNPYDNIATGAFYGFNPNNIANIKQSNNTYNIDPAIIQRNIVRYFLYHQAIINAKKKYNLDIIEIHTKDLISDPRGTLLNLCNSLGVTCSDNYLKICSSKIFKTESRTRHLVKWTDEQLVTIQQNIEKYRCLKGYNFNSM